MPIEFRCRQCGKLLRTDDDTAGRQAQCPGCGTISVVPLSTAPSEWSAPPLTPPSPPPGAGDLSWESPIVTGAEGSENPYRSPISPAPRAPLGEPNYSALQRVAAPAVALMITAILGILANLAVAVLYTAVLVMCLNGQIDKFEPQQDPNELMLGSAILIGVGILGLVTGAVALFGAIKMKKLESYTFAIAAAIIVMIPCISPCSLLGLPFGIWALVVLSDRSVRDAFRS